MGTQTGQDRARSFDFDPRTRKLRASGGEVSVLRPQTSEVLALLISRRGELVRKEELMSAVWADVAVTDDSLVQCISEIRKALGPADGELLATVPRKGYRLDLPEAAPRARRGIGARGASGLAAIAAVTAIALVFGPLPWQRGTPPVVPPAERVLDDLPSLAVLQFDNISGDPSQSYFSDGIADDLITELSKISGLVVIARATSFASRAAGGDATELSSQTGARYLVQGSVRHFGSRVRINVQLIDGQSGVNIWAERYEDDDKDVFAMQDRLTRAIATALQVKLTRDEDRRIGKPLTSSPEAYDLYLRGIRLVGSFTPSDNREAESLFRQAIALDPDFAAAWANLAQALSLKVENSWTDDPDGLKKQAFAAARKGIELDPELPFAHWSLGRIYSRPYAREYEAARTAFQTAVSLNPNYADGFMFLALTSIFTGHAEAAPPFIEKGMRLNPNYPFWYIFTEGMMQYYTGDYEAAAVSAERAIERNPAVPWLYQLIIPAYGQLGRTDDAEWMAEELLSLGQPATVSGMMGVALVEDPGYRALLEDGLRKGGLPEE